MIQVDVNRFVKHERKLYTKEWEEIPCTIGYPRYEGNIEKPIRLNEMINVAEVLAAEFIHVRVDLYHTNKGIFFGEMTFTPGNGIERFIPNDFAYEIGEMYNMIKE